MRHDWNARAGGGGCEEIRLKPLVCFMVTCAGGSGESGGMP